MGFVVVYGVFGRGQDNTKRKENVEGECATMENDHFCTIKNDLKVIQ